MFLNPFRNWNESLMGVYPIGRFKLVDRMPLKNMIIKIKEGWGTSKDKNDDGDRNLADCSNNCQIFPLDPYFRRVFEQLCK